MERFACSGSHGFIGEKLVRHLEQQGHEVARIGRDGFLRNKKPEVMFDLAAYGNMYDQKDMRTTYRANLLRVLNVLEELPKYSRFVYVSTSAVMLPVQTHYSVSKGATEKMLQVWNKDYAIVRPFSITGVGEQKEHLIPKLIDSCMNGTEMPFVSEPVHDFLDVEDFVDALMVVAESGEKGVFQVGSGKQYTNLQVKNTVESVTRKRTNVTIVPNMRNYDTKEWRADTTRMYSLGWEPKKTLRESIKEMYDAKRADNSDWL